MVKIQDFYLKSLEITEDTLFFPCCAIFIFLYMILTVFIGTVFGNTIQHCALLQITSRGLLQSQQFYDCDALNSSSLNMESFTGHLLFYLWFVMKAINLFPSKRKKKKKKDIFTLAQSKALLSQNFLVLKRQAQRTMFPNNRKLAKPEKKIVYTTKMHCFCPVGPQKPYRTFTNCLSTLHSHFQYSVN